MKNVKFDGMRWWLKTTEGFFNPYSEVLFSSEDQGKVNLIIRSLYPIIELGMWYEIPDNNIYTALHSNACRWDHKPPCHECDSRGVLAIIGDDDNFNMGSTDDGDNEIEAIKNGTSSISLPS